MSNEVERANPLPVGKYWVVITGKDQITQFDIWLDANVKIGALRVDSTQMLSKTPTTSSQLALLLIPVWGAIVAASRASDPDQEFVVFTVVQPNQVFWIDTFGLPSKSDPEVQSVSDVEQAPVVKSPIDDITKSIENLDVTKVALIGAVVLGGVLVYEWFKRKDRHG